VSSLGVKRSHNVSIVESHWHRLDNVTKELFAPLFAEIRRAASADPRPESPLSSPDVEAWLTRHHDREMALTQLREAQALTTDPTDPAPLACEGLSRFLDWLRRKEARRVRRHF
jgi:hypothetical protein